ncbi:MAG TPA: retroviral-like aspartic protease family protein [Blastocatellia bacterium]|nr:retroviral-like aspartic protease family protein [Blastocatellia bacterium]
MPDHLPYLWIESPPVPGFSITVSGPSISTTLHAIIDTGASHTVIPDYLVGQLRLMKIADQALSVRGPELRPDVADTYLARLSFLGIELRHAVLPRPEWDEVLIGRDILNAWMLTLDGPNRRFGFEIVKEG